KADYGLVVLFYSTSFTNSNLPTGILTSRSPAISHQIIGSASSASEPGLTPLTEGLQRDHAYRIFKSGPYDNANDHRVFVIWRKQVPKCPGPTRDRPRPARDRPLPACPGIRPPPRPKRSRAPAKPALRAPACAVSGIRWSPSAACRLLCRWRWCGATPL